MTAPWFPASSPPPSELLVLAEIKTSCGPSYAVALHYGPSTEDDMVGWCEQMGGNFVEVVRWQYIDTSAPTFATPVPWEDRYRTYAGRGDPQIQTMHAELTEWRNLGAKLLEPTNPDEEPPR